MTTQKLASLATLARQRWHDLDGEIAAWRAGTGSGVRLWCGPGCGNCCALTVNTTLAEAQAIAGAIDDGQRQRLSAAVSRIIAHAGRCRDARGFLSGYRQAVGPCPFLAADANCSIYSVRPLACRALLSIRPADWCGINLAELPACERDAFLASLDPTVVAFPTHYAAAPRELAADIEYGLTMAMVRTLGLGVSGSLPVLVWLAGLAGFRAALADAPRSFRAFRAFLADSDIDRPFLVQIATP